MRVFARHDDEVGECRLIHSTARAGTQNDRDLGNQARGLARLLEDTTVLSQRDDALLDAGAARILNADDRNTHADAPVDQVDDLVALDLAQGATQHREVLRVGGNHAPLHAAVTGGHGRTDATGAHRSADELTDLVPHAVIEEE